MMDDTSGKYIWVNIEIWEEGISVRSIKMYINLLRSNIPTTKIFLLFANNIKKVILFAKLILN